MHETLVVLIVFTSLCSPLIIAGLVYYKKKRFEHIQIMAAIEKGTPLSDLKPVKKHSGPAWIRETTSGIAMLTIAIGLTLLFLLMFNFGPRPHPFLLIMFLIPVVFFGNGLGALIRGRMLKKAPAEIIPEEQNPQNREDTTAATAMQ
jgi:hypothetical protein